MRRFGAIATLSTAAATLTLLGGCADVGSALSLAPGKIDPRSAVAATVQAAARKDYPYPSFRDVPPRPTDVRSADAYKAGVVGQIGERRAVKGWVAANPAMAGDSEGFAATGRAAIPADAIRPLGAAGTQETEAYAARVREQGAAPPPPK